MYVPEAGSYDPASVAVALPGTVVHGAATKVLYASGASGALESRSVPVFVALLVLLIRVLIIGSFTLGSGRLFSADERRSQLMLRPLAGRTQRPDARGANVPAGRPVRREPANVPAPAFIHSNES